jgi:hypothetical protein
MDRKEGIKLNAILHSSFFVLCAFKTNKKNQFVLPDLQLVDLVLIVVMLLVALLVVTAVTY